MSKNKGKFKTKFQEKLNEWLAETTSHGLPRIHNYMSKKNWPLCSLWAIATIASIAYCTVTIVSSVNQYYNWGVTITMSRVNDLPATFPAVTICNVNPFNEARNEFLKYVETKMNLSDCFTKSNITGFVDCFNKKYAYQVSFNNAFDIFLDKLKRIVADEYLTDEYRASLGYYLDQDMLISCKFNGDYCSEADGSFYRFWNNQYGNCYSFNYGQQPSSSFLQTSATGDQSGLHLELVVTSPNTTSFFAYQTGIYLMVHNQSEKEFTLPAGINIPTGFATYVGINRNFINKLNDPYSECLAKLTPRNSYAKILYGYFKALNVTNYDQNLCFTLCFQDKLAKKCNCYDISTPLLGNSSYSYCSTDEEIDCLNKLESFFTTNDMSELCESACPEQCNIIDYELTSRSKAYFPNLIYLKDHQTSDSKGYLFPQNQTDSDLIQFARQGFLKVVVNYESLYYTSINDNAAMTSNDLFGSIGGQLGLFAGLSVLSFLEVVELAISIVVIFYSLSNSRKNKAKDNNNKKVDSTKIKHEKY